MAIHFPVGAKFRFLWDSCTVGHHPAGKKDQSKVKVRNQLISDISLYI